MRITFRANPELEDGEINIVVEAAAPTADAIGVMKAAETLGRRASQTISIDTGDRLEIVRKNAVIAVEVHGNSLVVRLAASAGSPAHSLVTKDRLQRFLESLPSSDFMQISKQVAINLRHLQSLEASYSGNMTAKLTGGVDETVSRRYVAGLKQALGV
ncbi:LytTR family DNA-binding domain-containing protein [Bifidobacterium sp. ESL0763]|uniref:LytTR family DNA-binding domain-containing protein n=1 Tax=Bifidobacterium sp. ESL0763 TaxID=2983227 RepID=UPI0023F6D1C9|nr:LytTR family DNA-binding domain-containing protein [Bifidobacterium sp. ESL0763]MDF7663175.1 LytTR family DNA-binding domain-containing protein [Bifidobacterium sp. ESL0763]